MKTKQLVQMVVGLAVVVIVIAVANKLAGESAKKKSQELLYPDLNTPAIAALEVFEKDSTAKLSLKGSQWILPEDEGYRADSSLVGTVLRALQELEKKDLVSTNKEKQELYGVEGDSATEAMHVIARDKAGAALVDLWIGKRGFDVRSSEYVRKEGSNKVYATNEAIKIKFPSSSRLWRDREVWKVDREKVKVIEIAHGDQKYSLNRNPKTRKWTILTPDSVEADTNKIDGFLYSVCDVRTKEWAAKDDANLAKAFDKPEANVSVILGDGSSKSITVGQKKDDSYYARAEADTTIYLLAQYTVDGFKKKWEDLKFVPPPPDTTKADSTAPGLVEEAK